MCVISKYFTEKNKIGDFIPKETKALIICESPHKCEYCRKIPLAGNSGIQLSRVLFEGNNEMCRLPLGLILKSGESGERINTNKIALVNVCQYPLQDIGLPGYDENINMIRRAYNNAWKHREANLNEIENYILEDFIQRMNIYIRSSIVKIVVCGQFAKKYFTKVLEKQLQIPKMNIEYIRHPSGYNSKFWSNSKSNEYNAISSLRTFIQVKKS